MGQGAKKTETGCRPDQLFDTWAIEPERMKGMVELVKATDLASLRAANAAAPLENKPAYSVQNGVAVIPVSGPMTKYQTSFQSMLGGTSTLAVRQAIRSANADQNLNAILVHVESPGGTVSGVQELADAIASSRLPVYAYAEDLMASAALWAASSAKRIYANRSAQIGSIGAFVAIEDTSGAYAKDGVKVHVVNSGGVKGGGVDGAPVTDAYLAEVQKRIDAIAGQFVESVASGRAHAGMTPASAKALADGRMHTAAAAKELGLIDEVSSFEDALSQIVRSSMEDKALEVAEARALAAETELAALKVDAAKAAAQLQAIAAKERLATMQASLDALKNLPKADGLAAALVTLADAAPEAFAVVETQIRAWDGQVKVTALFEEKGTSRSDAKVPVNVNDPNAFRAAAVQMVKDGKAKDEAEAMTQLLKETK